MIVAAVRRELVDMALSFADLFSRLIRLCDDDSRFCNNGLNSRYFLGTLAGRRCLANCTHYFHHLRNYNLILGGIVVL